MTNLLQNMCEACNNLTPRLNDIEVAELLSKINGWDVIEGHHLYKRWTFRNFTKPLRLVLAISKLAEEEGHHPNISFGWGFIEVTIWTHVINGLSKNDFILAAKIDDIPVVQ